MKAKREISKQQQELPSLYVCRTYKHFSTYDSPKGTSDEDINRLSCLNNNRNVKRVLVRSRNGTGTASDVFYFYVPPKVNISAKMICDALNEFHAFPVEQIRLSTAGNRDAALTDKMSIMPIKIKSPHRISRADYVIWRSYRSRSSNIPRAKFPPYEPTSFYRLERLNCQEFCNLVTDNNHADQLLQFQTEWNEYKPQQQRSLQSVLLIGTGGVFLVTGILVFILSTASIVTLSVGFALIAIAVALAITGGVLRLLGTPSNNNYTPQDTINTWISNDRVNQRNYTPQDIINTWISNDRVNQRIIFENGEIRLATQEECELPVWRDDSNLPKPTNYRKTTTIANVIARNDLEFSPQIVEELLEALIENGANFQAIDYSDYCRLDIPSVQNNPLISLIALGSETNEYDSAIEMLITHIITLPVEVQKNILNHKDNYPGPSLPPFDFLVTQGKENLANILIDAKAPINFTKNILFVICASMGTSLWTQENGVAFIAKILDHYGSSLFLTGEDREALEMILSYPNNQLVEETRRHFLRQCNESGFYENRLVRDAAGEMQEELGVHDNMSNLKSVITTDPNKKHLLIEKLVTDRIFKNIRNDLSLQQARSGFDRIYHEYRTNCYGDMLRRKNFLQTEQGVEAAAQVLELVKQHVANQPSEQGMAAGARVLRY